jgi:DNA-binding CsgD family transcriptional regulator
MSAAMVPVPRQLLALLSSRQREIIAIVRGGKSLAETASDLGLSLATVSCTYYAAMRRVRGEAPPAKRRWDRDSDLDSETPAEARARVALELAGGLRCRAPMLSGGPCSLLLPCHTHRPGGA